MARQLCTRRSLNATPSAGPVFSIAPGSAYASSMSRRTASKSATGSSVSVAGGVGLGGDAVLAPSVNPWRLIAAGSARGGLTR